MAERVDLTVLVCVYNEADRVMGGLDDLFASMKRRSEVVEVILLDNYSIDGTRELLQKIDHPRVRLELNPRNLGKGGSIRKGIALSRGEYISIFDPDLEYSADDIWPLLDQMKDNGAMMGLASRVHGGRNRYEYAENYVGVRLLSLLINLLYGVRITDAATATKILKGDFVRSVRFDAIGFDLDFQLLTRIARLGGRVCESKAEYYPRTVAEGKKVRAVQDGIKALQTILRDRILSKSAFHL